MKKLRTKIELPTLGLIWGTYSTWVVLLVYNSVITLALWIILFALNITLFLSITHEVVHGHPTRNKLLNRLLVLMPIGWVFPYERFRDTHIEHHTTDFLTDPLDDPESWYEPRFQYEKMNRWARSLLTFNNTLFGRMLIGPAISISKFYISEVSQIIHNKTSRKYLITIWAQHLVLCLGMVIFIAQFSTVPVWAIVLSLYLGLSILLVRTFLEHQAAEDFQERTVIIEHCCPLAFLFLYNNLHAVHHEHPRVPWYELPRLYKEKSQHFKNLNNHYIYSSYGEVFRKYFLTPKEQIPHPFLRSGQ